MAKEPVIICFVCQFGWGYSSLESISEVENAVPVSCSSKVDAQYILEAFQKGADGVLILGCPEGRCHFEDGNFRQEKKVYFLQKILEDFGIQKERLRMVLSKDPSGKEILKQIQEMKQTLAQMGHVRGG